MRKKLRCYAKDDWLNTESAQWAGAETRNSDGVESESRWSSKGDHWTMAFRMSFRGLSFILTSAEVCFNI